MGGKTQWETEGPKTEERGQDGAEAGYLSCAGYSDAPASARKAPNFFLELPREAPRPRTARAWCCIFGDKGPWHQC